MVNHATHRYLSQLIIRVWREWMCMCMYKKQPIRLQILPPLVTPRKTQVIFVRTNVRTPLICSIHNLIIFNKFWLCCNVGDGSLFSIVMSTVKKLLCFLWYYCIYLFSMCRHQSGLVNISPAPATCAQASCIYVVIITKGDLNQTACLIYKEHSLLSRSKSYKKLKQIKKMKCW